jgi:hypothetical protein
MFEFAVIIITAMSSVFGKFRQIVSAVLIALLICAQTISIAHAYEHDPESTQGTACAVCVSANQLEAAAVDNGQATAPRGFKTVIGNDRATRSAIVDLHAPRGRGPPTAP